jgi:photosystem II stability/assembly factor-like uncharacterized protein
MLPVQSYAANDSFLFAGCMNNSNYQNPSNEIFGDVYRTGDKGVTWQRADAGLPLSASFSVYSVAVQGQYVYAGTNRGAWRSADNGDSWVSVNAGHGDSLVRMIGTTDNMVFAFTSSCIYRSSDHGNTWTSCMIGPSNLYFISFVNTGSALLALDAYTGLYRSLNNGISWQNIQNVTGWTTLINMGGHLFSYVNQYLIRSDDNGDNWTIINDTLQSYTLAVKGSSIFSGGYGYFYRSDDLCNTWTSIINGIPLDGISSMGTDNSSVYVNTSSYGTYRTDNNGMSWSPANNGLPFDRVNTIVTKWTNIFTGTNGGGVFLSTDLGVQWTPQNTLLSAREISSLAIDGNEIYAGTDQGIFISNTFGEHWVAYNSGLTSKNVSSILKDSTGNLFTGTEGGGVFLSQNDGLTWNAVNSGLTNQDVRCLIKAGAYLFCGTHGGGVFRSDNGSSWTSVNTGITNLNVNSLVSRGNALFAGTENGAWLSSDHGNTWSSIATGLSNPFITTLTLAGSQVFAGTKAGVYRYSDTGSEWVKVSEMLPDTVVTAMAASKTDLFAGVARQGVWTRPLSDFSLLDVSPGSLTLNETSNSSDTIFVISSSDWILHGTLPDWLWVDNWTGTGNGILVFQTIKANPDAQERSAGFYLSSGNGASVAFTVIQKAKSSGIAYHDNPGLIIYPVPSSGLIHVENVILIDEITVSDLEGKVIFRQEPGSAKEIIDLSGQGKGVYFIRVITSEGVSVKKVLVE